MARQPDEFEKEVAKEALVEAILEDGKGKDYYSEFGRYLWEPDVRSLTWNWNRRKGAFTYSMGATDSQVVAYYHNGQVRVTHNGYERHIVRDELGW